MSVTAAKRGFVVLLLTVPVIHGQDDWDWSVKYTPTQICALKGSTVDIRCTFTYPPTINERNITVEKMFWFTKTMNGGLVDLMTDSDYRGRVKYDCKERNCTLRIRGLKESDSAVYKFRFITNQPGGSFTGSPGVALSVTDLKVEVRRSSSLTELKCKSSCDLTEPPSYVWYNNGQKIEEEAFSFRVAVRNDDSYSCAVKGHEDHRSLSVYVPKPPSVSVSPSGEIVEGTSVTLTCHSDANPAARYSWYRRNVRTPVTEEQTLVFTAIQRSRSGEYYCTPENKLGSRTSEAIAIDVKYAPKPPSVSVSPSDEIVEGTSVTLICRSDANPAARYSWYRRSVRIPVSKEQALVFTSIQSSESGEYYCTSENELGSRTSESINIDVKYPPKTTLLSVSPSGEIKEGISVTLTCYSDANPAAKYLWYRRGDHIYVEEKTQLVFTYIVFSDSGEYYCTAVNNLGTGFSEVVFINVKYVPKPPSVSVSPSDEMLEGTSVTLACHSDANPEAKYSWYRRDVRTPVGEEQTLVFKSIQSSESGEYYCTPENELGSSRSQSIAIDVKYRPKPPSVSMSPFGEIKYGSSVTLTCHSDANPAATYFWYRKGLHSYIRESRKLTFTSIVSSDSGEYYCTAENRFGTRRSKNIFINVKYNPKPPSVSVCPSGLIVEGTSVTLTCHSDANPIVKYYWYKRNVRTPVSEEQALVFTSIQSSQSGEYYCTPENELGSRTSESINIDVKYAPKPPSVSVSPSGEIVEEISVILTCRSDANPAARYSWYRRDVRTPVSEEQTLVFPSIQSSESGEYYCTPENELGSGTPKSISIDVKYPPRPPSMLVSPSGEIVEGGSVTLTCHSDANPAADYTWYREDGDSPIASGQNLTISNITFKHSGNYYCDAHNIRGRRNATYFHVNVVAKAWKLITVATLPAVLLALIPISVIAWILKKQTSEHHSDPGEEPETREQFLQVKPADDELAYVNVYFSKEPEEDLYPTLRPVQASRHVKRKREEDMVEYAPLKLYSVSSSPSRLWRRSEEAPEDPAVLYSTVNKPKKQRKQNLY